MTTLFDIRLANLDDAPAISKVIASQSAHFLTHPNGVDTDAVLLSIEPDGIAEFITAPHFCHWVATFENEVIAVAGLRDNSHLYHLFVSSNYQGRGVGRALWELAKTTALANGNINRFTVNSTLTGRPFYEKLGFTPAGPITQREGMTYIPMVLRMEP